MSSAPSALRVSIRTAVWMAGKACQTMSLQTIEVFILMCKHPAIRAPFSGCSCAYFSLVITRPGISCSASSISLRPKAARLMSATLNFCAGSPIVMIVSVVWYGCSIGLYQKMERLMRNGRTISPFGVCKAAHQKFNSNPTNCRSCPCIIAHLAPCNVTRERPQDEGTSYIIDADY